MSEYPDAGKQLKLTALLHSYGRVAIAFSGGVDSSFLALAAAAELGKDSVLLLYFKSVFSMAREEAFAISFAADNGLTLQLVEGDVLAEGNIRNNGVQRCYFCKKMIMGALRRATVTAGFTVLLDGTNLDDLDDYRPGQKAADELGVLHPLLEAGLTKDDIRSLGKEAGLVNYAAPAAACLASRVPYGTTLDPELLKRIDDMEISLAELGFCGARARAVLPRTVKVEVRTAEELIRAAAMSMEFAAAGAKAGFKDIWLDLQLYRRGSLNADVEKNK